MGQEIVDAWLLGGRGDLLNGQAKIIDQQYRETRLTRESLGHTCLTYA